MKTIILNFRHYLEAHKFGKKIFDTINQHLADKGLRLRAGTIVDATIIAAPTSTKNTQGERDLEMHQFKKGNEWHHRMKMHIGVDDSLGLIHRMSQPLPTSMTLPKPINCFMVMNSESEKALVIWGLINEMNTRLVK